MSSSSSKSSLDSGRRPPTGAWIGGSGGTVIGAPGRAAAADAGRGPRAGRGAGRGGARGRGRRGGGPGGGGGGGGGGRVGGGARGGADEPLPGRDRRGRGPVRQAGREGPRGGGPGRYRGDAGVLAAAGPAAVESG